MGVVTCANLYGQDGTALWLTVLMPGTERADVRGRQLAWALLYGSMALVLTVAGTVASGRADLWPWALAATAAVVGGGAGLLPLIGVGQLVPGPDPHQNRNSPLDHGDLTGQAFVAMFLAAVLPLPALLPAIIGAALDSDALIWAAVPAGILTGALGYWLFGTWAAQSLAVRGPELLFLMRAGKEQKAQALGDTSAFAAMPKVKQHLLWTSVTVGCIALFPQALVPLVMKLTDQVEPVWFLALHLPLAWQWPTIILMFLLAAGAFALAGRIYVTELRKLRERQERERSSQVPA
jgi:ABC-2 type transport system permease protein